jgi:hypothetical protein
MITLHFLKKIITAAFFAALTFTAHSQSYTIASPLGNGTFYIGMEHTISGFVEGHKCKDISLITDKGKLFKREGKYIFQSDSLGTVNISINIKVGGKSKRIGSSKFRVIELPDPIALIGGKANNDTMVRRILIAQGGVSAKYLFCCFDGLSAKVTSFRILIIRKDSSVSKSCYNEGNGFAKETRAFISTIEAGDQLIIYSILANTYQGHKISVAPLLLNVAD